MKPFQTVRLVCPPLLHADHLLAPKLYRRAELIAATRDIQSFMTLGSVTIRQHPPSPRSLTITDRLHGAHGCTYGESVTESTTVLALSKHTLSLEFETERPSYPQIFLTRPYERCAGRMK